MPHSAMGKAREPSSCQEHTALWTSHNSEHVTEEGVEAQRNKEANPRPHINSWQVWRGPLSPILPLFFPSLAVPQDTQFLPGGSLSQASFPHCQRETEAQSSPEVSQSPQWLSWTFFPSPSPSPVPLPCPLGYGQGKGTQGLEG